MISSSAQPQIPFASAAAGSPHWDQRLQKRKEVEVEKQALQEHAEKDRLAEAAAQQERAKQLAREQLMKAVEKAEDGSFQIAASLALQASAGSFSD